MIPLIRTSNVDDVCFSESSTRRRTFVLQREEREKLVVMCLLMAPSPNPCHRSMKRRRQCGWINRLQCTHSLSALLLLFLASCEAWQLSPTRPAATSTWTNTINSASNKPVITSPSMLLQVQSLNKLLQSTPTSLGPASPDDADSRRQRGVLGFALPELEPGSRPHATRLSSLQARTTNFDAAAWNVQENSHWKTTTTSTIDDIPWLSATSTSSILSKKLADDETTITTTNSNNIIPWIPSPAQIRSLKRTELQRLCVERGLIKSGNKSDLQERLIEWVQKVPRSSNTALGFFQAYGVAREEVLQASNTKRNTDSQPPNSLAEWARTVDLEPLLHRRQEIRREQLHGKKVTKKNNKNIKDDSSTEDYLSVLKKVFDKPSSPYSNREVKLMYQAAKHADQMGDETLSRRLLQQLLTVTPNDARLYRRLSRLEQQTGNSTGARAVLQEGLRQHPDNAHLWQGLGSLLLQQKVHNTSLATHCFRRAIQLDPSFPNAYHALGTAQHTAGHIARARRTFQEGLQYCPKNNRLHHALGDLYRDAKMLDLAERSYRKALKYSPDVSRGFAYNALACVAYERGQIQECRQWLQEAIQQNNGRNAKGWMVLAQMEEAAGNTDAARAACLKGLNTYERHLFRTYGPARTTNRKSPSSDLFSAKRKLWEDTVPSYRSGDHFYHLYRTWGRLEERYGSSASVDEVYDRAAMAFPTRWNLLVDWAEYYQRLNMPHQTRALFTEACVRSSHAEPYRLYAQYEMNQMGNYTGAQQILYAGALVASTGHQGPLAELFHTWAVCEWHLGNWVRAENLLDHALRCSTGLSPLRAYVLYTLALLEHHRGEHILAQHCIGLALKENSLPGGNARIWNLWAAVAEALKNEALAEECREQATKKVEEQSLAGMLVQKVRLEPWHQEIFGTEKASKFFYTVRFPFHVGSSRDEPPVSSGR